MNHDSTAALVAEPYDGPDAEPLDGATPDRVPEGLNAIGPDAGINETTEPSPVAHYRKKNVQPMRPYVPGEDLIGVSVNVEDTPEEGGMIAHNPANPKDQWYVAKRFFADNYEPAADPAGPAHPDSPAPSAGQADESDAAFILRTFGVLPQRFIKDGVLDRSALAWSVGTYRNLYANRVLSGSAA